MIQVKSQEGILFTININKTVYCRIYPEESGLSEVKVQYVDEQWVSFHVKNSARVTFIDDLKEF